ncbi:hypothetical protein DUNSADRAFT_9731, partial [Dunaliella salina]
SSLAGCVEDEEEGADVAVEGGGVNHAWGLASLIDDDEGEEEECGAGVVVQQQLLGQQQGQGQGQPQGSPGLCTADDDASDSVNMGGTGTTPPPSRHGKSFAPPGVGQLEAGGFGSPAGAPPWNTKGLCSKQSEGVLAANGGVDGGILAANGGTCDEGMKSTWRGISRPGRDCVEQQQQQGEQASGQQHNGAGAAVHSNLPTLPKIHVHARAEDGEVLQGSPKLGEPSQGEFQQAPDGEPHSNQQQPLTTTLFPHQHYHHNHYHLLGDGTHQHPSHLQLLQGGQASGYAAFDKQGGFAAYNVVHGPLNQNDASAYLTLDPESASADSALGSPRLSGTFDPTHTHHDSSQGDVPSRVRHHQQQQRLHTPPVIPASRVLAAAAQHSSPGVGRAEGIGRGAGRGTPRGGGAQQGTAAGFGGQDALRGQRGRGGGRGGRAGGGRGSNLNGTDGRTQVLAIHDDGAAGAGSERLPTHTFDKAGGGGAGGDSAMVNLTYDPMLNCYYDPSTQQYYEV